MEYTKSDASCLLLPRVHLRVLSGTVVKEEKETTPAPKTCFPTQVYADSWECPKNCGQESCGEPTEGCGCKIEIMISRLVLVRVLPRRPAPTTLFLSWLLHVHWCNRSSSSFCSLFYYFFFEMVFCVDMPTLCSRCNTHLMYVCFLIYILCFIFLSFFNFFGAGPEGTFLHKNGQTCVSEKDCDKILPVEPTLSMPMTATEVPPPSLPPPNNHPTAATKPWCSKRKEPKS